MPKLITGQTGCGKTFHAINDYKGSFAYIAPCKQLVYEVFQDYGNCNTRLETGDVHLVGTENFMGTYEAFDPGEVQKYDRIIIDESHYLKDSERGGHLMNIISSASKQAVEVLLLTATQNLSDELLDQLNVDEVELKPRKKVPEKKQVDIEIFEKNIIDGHRSIVFSKYTPGPGYAKYFIDTFNLLPEEVAVLSASNTSMERITVQNRFRKGEIRVLICTNVLAQGINFPTTNILIEYNERDDWEVIEQKLGRLGRPTFCENIDEVYYHLSYKLERTKVFKLNHAHVEPTNISSIALHPLQRSYMPHTMIHVGNLGSYREYKYCYPSVRELLETKNYYPQYKNALEEVYEFLENDRNALKSYLESLHI